MQPIQIKLKIEIFFLNSANLNEILNILKKKKNINFIAYVLTKTRIPKDVVRQMPKKSCFRRLYYKQHRKRFQTVLKYERQHFYQI